MWGKSSPFACAAWTEGGRAKPGEGGGGGGGGGGRRRKDLWPFIIVYDTLILPYEIICIW